MKILVLLTLLIANANGAIRTEGEFILPLQRKNYPLKELIKDYAEALQFNISYPEETLEGDKSTVDLSIHEKISFTQFSTLFQSILDSRGYSLIQEKGFQWIAQTRDVRFRPTEFYANRPLPNDENYVTALFRLKYPIASEITRNLRPFMSRYGRVINFGDGRSIVINDRGSNALRLYETIKFMDTEKVYMAALNKKPKEPDPENNEVNQKLIELELKNKILEKKLIEQKDGGANENSSSTDHNRN
ncbi:MAG: hypothetical protein HYV97_01490 [Bdellovibrio sp.]|nr:hypothetical protein [Bdellovibrio sp.]